MGNSTLFPRANYNVNVRRREVRKGHKLSLTWVAYQRQPGKETVWSRLLQGQTEPGSLATINLQCPGTNGASRLAKGSHSQQD